VGHHGWTLVRYSYGTFRVHRTLGLGLALQPCDPLLPYLWYG
jgi:hypothetical protein